MELDEELELVSKSNENEYSNEFPFSKILSSKKRWEDDDEDEEPNENKSPRIMNGDLSPRGYLNTMQSKNKNNSCLKATQSNTSKESKPKNVSFQEGDSYMKSKMNYFTKLNVARSEIKEVQTKTVTENSLTCKSAPQSNPIPISLENVGNSIFDPQLVVNTFSSTFIPPHEMTNRSEFSVWEKDRKKIPQKYHN